jgi:hypothetical protein
MAIKNDPGRFRAVIRCPAYRKAMPFGVVERP